MPGSPPADATFRQLDLPRAKAGNFLLKVQRRMLKAVEEWGDVLVRMEVKTTGGAPNYRFERPTGEPLITIDGKKHKALEDGGEGETWSTATMSFEEVSLTARELLLAEFQQLWSSSGIE